MYSVHLLNASRFFLLLTVCIAPWCFGGKYASSQQYLFAGVTLSVLFLLLGGTAERSSNRRLNRHVPLLLIPLTLALVYSTIQSLPLGLPGLANREFGYSPTEWNEILAFAASPFSVTSLDTNVVSFCPSETRLIVLHLAVAIAGFLSGSALFVRTKSVMTLWIVVLINGITMSIFGIIQKIFFNGKLFWTYEIIGDAQPFASFLNRNNASGYLNMVCACGIGLWLWSHSRQEKDRSIQMMLTRKNRTTAIAEFTAHLRQFLAELNGTKLLAVLLTTISFAGVVASASRGGIGALCLGIGVLYFALARRRQWVAANSIAVFPLLGVIFVLAYAGLTQNVGDRLDTISWENFQHSARWKNWWDASHAFENHYVWGTGLGTYRFVYLPFQTYIDPHIYYYAENQYLQTAIEMGIPGILLLLCVLFMTGKTLHWFLFAKKRPEFDPIAYCGLFVFVTQFVQGLVDFGLYRTGNMLLCATLIGSLCGREAFLRRGKKEATEKKTSGKTGLICLTLLCLVSTALATVESYRKAPLEERDFGKKTLNTEDALSRNEVDQQIQTLTNGLRFRPDDPEAGLLVARLLIYRYRLDYFEEFMNEASSRSETSKRIAWNSSGMLYFHNYTIGLRSSQNESARQRLLETQSVRENLVAAYLYLKQADKSCPIIPRIKLLLAQLGPLMGDSKTQVQNWIRQAANLNVVNPELQYVAGFLAFQEEMNAECAGYWKQALSVEDEALQLDDQLLISIYQTSRLRWSPEFIVKNIFPEKPVILMKYAMFDIARLQKPEHTIQGISVDEVQSVVDLLANKTIQILSNREEYELTANDHLLMAQAERIKNKNDEAVRHFQRAVEASSVDVTIRYEFAKFLVELERYEEAEKQAAMCTQLNTREQKYKELEAKIIKLKLENSTKDNIEKP